MDPARIAEIEEEERVREKFRRESSRSKLPAAWRSVVTFVNSSFGLWFLSTVVAGGITWYISGVIERTAMQQKADESAATTVSELRYRLRGYRGRLQDIANQIDSELNNKLIVNAQDCTSFFIQITKAHDDAERPISSVTTELKADGIIALLVRLEKESNRSTSGSTTETKINIANLAKARDDWELLSKEQSQAYWKAVKDNKKDPYLLLAQKTVGDAIQILERYPELTQ